MRYFIVAVETNSDSPYYMEMGWTYYHDPKVFSETEDTIEVDNALHPSDHHKQAPKNLLLEITKDDYDLLHEIDDLGYDSSNMQDQIINCRGSDESNERPFAVKD